jgi:hypothetical protein
MEMYEHSTLDTIVPLQNKIQRTFSEETRLVRNNSSTNHNIKPTFLDPSSSLITLNDYQMKLWTQYQSLDNTELYPCNIMKQELYDSHISDNNINPTMKALDQVVMSQHRRDYSQSGSILTYSEDDTDESIRWNERLGGSRDEGEWNSLLQSVGDIHSLYDPTRKETIQKQEFLLSSNKRDNRKQNWNYYFKCYVLFFMLFLSNDSKVNFWRVMPPLCLYANSSLESILVTICTKDKI